MQLPVPNEIIEAMIAKIVRVDCDADYRPYNRLICRARKEYVSQLGDVIHKGDYYYYCANIGVAPYVSIVRPPVAYKNVLYVPGTDGYRKAMKIYNEQQEALRRAERLKFVIKIGDDVVYDGTQYVVKGMYKHHSLTVPLVLLFNTRTKKYYTDSLTGAICMVSLCYCKKAEEIKNYALYQIQENFNEVSYNDDGPEAEFRTNDINDACEFFCEDLGDDFFYDEDTHECYDKSGNVYIVKEYNRNK